MSAWDYSSCSLRAGAPRAAGPTRALGAVWWDVRAWHVLWGRTRGPQGGNGVPGTNSDHSLILSHRGDGSCFHPQRIGPGHGGDLPTVTEPLVVELGPQVG